VCSYLQKKMFFFHSQATGLLFLIIVKLDTDMKKSAK
jgi:hypothetical protein